MREIVSHSNSYSEGEDCKGTRYILKLDVFVPEDDPDADIRTLYDLLGDCFNVPHNLEIMIQENVVFKRDESEN